MNAVRGQSFSPIIRFSAGVGSAALALSCIGAGFDPAAFFKNYLFSFLFWVDLPLGALALFMIYPLTEGRWGAAVRNILQAAADTLWPLTFFAVPILLGLRQIYPWMDPSVASEPKVLHKQLYLNPLSFDLRTLFYFACWLVLNFLIQRHSGALNREASPEARAKLRRVSAGGLVVLGFTLSFAAIDWQMSVEPTWYSTIYGMVFVVGQVLSAYSLGLVVFGIAVARMGYEDLFPKKTFRDLGNILLMLVMVWAYLSFMQYLIVWSGNLPHEVIWYNHRTQGGWQWLTLLIALLQFGLPFLLLLFRSSKSQASRLAWIGALLFGVRILDHYWMLMPGLKPEHFTLHWQTLTTWLGIGGVWLAFFLRRLERKSYFPESDPDWPKASETRHAPAGPSVSTLKGEPLHG